MQGQPCTECGQRMAANEWTFVYGHPSRGMKPKTGEIDRRPLGKHEVFACRPCEWRAVRGNLRDVAMATAIPSLAAVAGLALFFFGVAPPPEDARGEITRSVMASAAVAGWATFAWVRNRPRFMRKQFFRVHQRGLATKHGLKPNQVAVYEELAA